MGRKKITPPLKRLETWVTEDAVSEITELCETLQISKPEFLRKAINNLINSIKKGKKYE